MPKLELTRIMRRQQRFDRVGLVLALLLLAGGLLSAVVWLA